MGTDESRELASGLDAVGRFLLTYATVTLPIGAAVAGVGAAAGAVPASVPSFLVLWVATWALVMALMLTFCVWWVASLRGTVYRLTADDRLEVIRSGKARTSVPVAELDGFRIEGRMDRRSILTLSAQPPPWPEGVALHRGRRPQRLPAVLVWGNPPLRSVEDEVERRICAVRRASGG